MMRRAEMPRRKADPLIVPEAEVDVLPEEELSDRHKAAMLMMRARNMSIEEIAEASKLRPDTVRGYIDRVGEIAAETWMEYDFREDLQRRAVDAVKSGLDCDTDPYKRSALGVNVLKGVGVLSGDSPGVNLNELFASVPDEFRSRYIKN